MITASDDEFGAQLSNGSWTGMIGMIINKVGLVYHVIFVVIEIELLK